MNEEVKQDVPETPVEETVTPEVTPEEGAAEEVTESEEARTRKEVVADPEEPKEKSLEFYRGRKVLSVTFDERNAYITDIERTCYTISLEEYNLLLG